MFYGVGDISSTPSSKNITLLFKSDDYFNKFISIGLLILYNACILSLGNASIFSEISIFCFNSGFVIKSLYKILGVIPKKFIKSISVFLLVPSLAVSNCEIVFVDFDNSSPTFLVLNILLF